MALVGVQSGENFLDANTLLSQFNQLSQSQQDIFKNLAGKGIPRPSTENTFLSGAVFPSDPVQVYGLTQWKPPKVASLLGGLITTTQPEGYGALMDFSILNEYYPRYLQQVSPLAKTVEELKSTANSYNRDMFASYGNTYFNSLEKSQMQDKQAKLLQLISSAVIAVAAWGASVFATPLSSTTPVASTATVTNTGTIDPSYFGFEGSTFQSLGVSEFSFGPNVLTPQATATLTGASAFAGGGFIENIGNSLSNFVKGTVIAKPVSEIVSIITNSLGKIGDALKYVLNGDFVSAGKVFTGGIPTTPGTTPPNLFGNYLSGGSGGSGLGVGANSGQSTTNPLVFPVMGIAVLFVVWLIVRKK